MNPPFQKTFFIFRRDLRLEDNTGLIYALKQSKEVIAAFIFTPDQIEKNPYRSDHCLQFMIESLKDLEKELLEKKGKLYLFFGKPENIVAECIEKLNIDAVVVNRDYTPYSISRDKEIQSTCEKYGIAFQSFDDVLLHKPEQTLKSNKKPYLIFTPFYRNASKLEVPLPSRNKYSHYYRGAIDFSKSGSLYKKILSKSFIQMPGGRNAALYLLDNISDFADYGSSHDFPTKMTTHLSAHLKFTTCSIRETYHTLSKKLGPKTPLLRALYWREFFTLITFHFPYVLKGSFYQKFDRIAWKNNKKDFQLWCEGKTGFPIVDAGMREMNETGFMHNRVRMIAASFLVKDLHINWRWGEKYFAQTLVDYDPAVNNGNWQWVAGTGSASQPYFRIFNPWSQQIKFDPDCLYIKHWIPELASYPPKVIHGWNFKKNRIEGSPYPSPLVDHSKESGKALDLYKSL